MGGLLMEAALQGGLVETECLWILRNGTCEACISTPNRARTATQMRNEVFMGVKRSFSAGDIPTKATDYHGTAKYARTSPDVAAKGVESINVYLSFEEALRL